MIEERTAWTPATAAEKAEARREVDRVLADPTFANSKRYTTFLRFVVDKVLDGKSDELKERVLGIEVFQRPNDYDTNNDTIVRVTAGEVRKRLTSFYGGVGADHPIRIVLPLGSYVPGFYRVVSADVSPAPGQQRKPSWSRSSRCS